ncbi:TPA: hypothetical protein RUZ30_002458 [Vibrio cholerae]|nr:hypothetical protein [Vibrio cholerae]
MRSYRLVTARSPRHQQRGSVSIEVALIVPMLLVMILASSEILTIFRVEQRLVNLNYNVLEMVGNQRTLTRDNNIAQLPYFRDFAEQQLSQLVQGHVGLSIGLHNAATQETQILLRDNRCPLTQSWPKLEVGSVVQVSLCFEPNSQVADNAIWKLWPKKRFSSSMFRETN